jgi:hypothetical protein
MPAALPDIGGWRNFEKPTVKQRLATIRVLFPEAGAISFPISPIFDSA